ncbi:DNA polymerase delta subunit 4 [Marasmius crinis-equi]|uniref:DNA polymerase delta subunit 4 n=1 Tax=Marasmius crinis-equi TaxID=585013 RepID=A0ABR3FD68_9AGAR
MPPKKRASEDPAQTKLTSYLKGAHPNGSGIKKLKKRSLSVDTPDNQRHEVQSELPACEAVSEEQLQTQLMLTQFDMDYKYGPCLGMTRRDRWTRAVGLGRNPPQEVMDAIVDKEGNDIEEFKWPSIEYKFGHLSTSKCPASIR